MPKPKHQRVFVAQREFTDREKPVSLFLHALNHPQPYDSNKSGNSVYRVLMFYGVGGQGKSALFRQLNRLLDKLAEERKRAQTQTLAFASLDLEGDKGNNANSVTALLKLRLELKGKGKFPCPHFDVAFSRYFALSRKGTNIRDEYPELFRGESEFLNDIVDIAGDLLSEVPGWSFIHKHADRLRIRGQEWWERKGLRVLNDLDRKDQTQLERDLPMYLGADLVRAQEADPTLRLSILFDTYEYLWRDSSARSMHYLIDDWIRILVEESPGVLFTFFGRDKLRWGEEDPEWTSLLSQHILGGLSDTDADHFLKNAGVEEQEVREVIIESSKGDLADTQKACLPFYLDLQLEQYEVDRNQNAEIKATNYGGAKPRILDRLLKPPYTDRDSKNTLEVIGQARFVTQEIHSLLLDKFLGNNVLKYKELLSYSFIEEQKGQLVLHALMREYLRETLKTNDPPLFEKIHRTLFEFHAKKALPGLIKQVSPVHEAAFLEAMFHLEQVNNEEFINWVLKQVDIFFKAGKFLFVHKVGQYIYEVSQSIFGIEHTTTLESMSLIAVSLDRLGKYPSAMRLIKQTLTLQRKTLGNNHPETLKSMYNLANSMYGLGDYKAAKELRQETLELQQQVLGIKHSDTLGTMMGLANSLRSLGSYQEAKELYQKSLELRLKDLSQDHPEILRNMYGLASTYVSLGDYKEAQKIYSQTLELQEKVLGNQHPETLGSLMGLAISLHSLGDYQEAQRLYQKSFENRQSVLGSERWTPWLGQHLE